MTSSFTILLYVTIKSKSIVCVRVVRTADEGTQTDLVTTLLSNNYTHAVQYGIHLTLVPSTQCDMNGPAINTHENCYTVLLQITKYTGRRYSNSITHQTVIVFLIGGDCIKYPFASVDDRELAQYKQVYHAV